MKGFHRFAPALAICLAAAALCPPTVADAQVQVGVTIAVPVFQVQIGGPLVYVGSGIWVLADSQDEVFYSNGWYWARAHGHWYRSHGRRGGWGVVDERHVPRRVMRVPHGHYRDYHAPPQARRMAPPGWGSHGRRGEGHGKHGEDRGGMERPRQVQPGAWQRMGPGPAPKHREGDRKGGHGEGHGEGHGGGRGGGHGRGH
ncbi:MAG: hypothetical protein HY902_20010 [Deltaproteobacteria bacterium]|nr:hypothetical protein [Deltaproteobacteria bacterium]